MVGREAVSLDPFVFQKLQEKLEAQADYEEIKTELRYRAGRDCSESPYLLSQLGTLGSTSPTKLVQSELGMVTTAD